MRGLAVAAVLLARPARGAGLPPAAGYAPSSTPVEFTPPPAPRPAVLTARFDPLPAAPVLGRPFPVRLTVSNEGESRALGVYLAPFAFSGPEVARLGGPAVSSTLPLGAGESLVFSWTCAGAAAGWTGFSVTVTAQDEYFRRAVWAWAESAPLRICRPAHLEAAGVLSRTTVSAGQWVVLKLTVTNTGDAPATDVQPYVADRSTAALRRLKGPSPPGPVTLAGGRARRFAWGWLTRTPGGMVFLPGVDGQDGTTGEPLSVTVTVTGRVLAPARLSASIECSATRFKPGEKFQVRVTVANTGEAACVLRPPAPQLAGPGRATVKEAPPAESVTLTGGASRTWVWTYAATAPGALSAAAVASGRDAQSELEVSAATGSTLPFAIGALKIVVAACYASPPQVDLGGIITVYLTVSNAGTIALDGVSPRLLAVDGDGMVGIESGPLPATISIPPGRTATFVWRERALRPGTVTFRDTVASWDGAASPEGKTAPVTILSAMEWRGGPQAVPNPYDRREAGGRPVLFRHLPPGSHVTIHDLAGELVDETDTGADGTAAWDTHNRSGTPVAPGVYMFTAQGAGGTAAGKVVIK